MRSYAPAPPKKATSYYPVCWKREGARHLDSLSCAMAQNWKSLGGNESPIDESLATESMGFGRSKQAWDTAEGF